jgi:hypothetical protein
MLLAAYEPHVHGEAKPMREILCGGKSACLSALGLAHLFPFPGGTDALPLG